MSEIEIFNKVWAYRQAMINDTEFDVETDCIRCGAKDISWQQIEGFTLQAHGGYSDFVDTAFDEKERICNLCHDCAHKLLLFFGRRASAWIDSYSSTSHIRNTCKRNCKIDHNCYVEGMTKSWNHHGWDNRRIRGLISGIVYYYRLAGWRGSRYLITSLLADRKQYINQKLEWLNYILEEITIDPDTRYTDSDIHKAELEVREARKWKW